MQIKEDELISVVKVEDIDDTISLLKLEFKENPECYYFGNFLDTLEYQNQIICYQETYGVIKGERQLCANDVQIISRVNVIESEKLLKLYPNELPKNDSTISFNDIEVGDPARVETLYCTDVSFESSKRADWRVLTLMDKDWKIAQCRQFSPEDKDTSPIGKYIDIRIRKTQYGFNADEFSINPNLTMIENPRVLLAIRYIEQEIKDDFDLNTVVQNNGLLNVMKNYVLGEAIETGYDCVRLAEQIYFARALTNVTKSYDIQLLIRYFVLSRMYMLKMKPTSALSETALNIMLIARTPFGKDGKLLSLIDDRSHQVLSERDLIPHINGLVECIQNADTTYLYEDLQKRRRM